MGHVTSLAGWVFWRSGTECGSESRAVNMAPRLSGNDVSGNDVSGNDVSGNDVRAEMTSAEMTTETGSEVKTFYSRRPSWIYKVHAKSLILLMNKNKACMGAAPINLS